jgi:hypothetical protein
MKNKQINLGKDKLIITSVLLALGREATLKIPECFTSTLE